MKWTRKVTRPVIEFLFPGARRAREAMEQSQADAEDVDRLVADLKRLHADNHFSQALARTLGGR